MPRRGPHHDNITWLPHVRVAWGGILGNSGEVWTNSLKYLPDANSVITPSQATTAMGHVKTTLTQWFQSTAADSHSLIGIDAKMTWVKINSINGDGLQYGDTNILEFAPVLGVAGEGTTVPYYQTFALSLMTAKKRGRAHIGRIYPPLVDCPVTPGAGLCDPLQAAAMAKAFANFLTTSSNYLQADIGVGNYAVLSPGDSLKSTLPLSTTITGVTCDTVPDTQHRRVNRLVGVRSALQVSTQHM